MATSNFKDIADADLVRALRRREHEMVRARFSLSMNRLENTASIAVIRKDIARIKTELRRREIAAGLDLDALLRQHVVDPRSLDLETAGEAGGGFLQGVVDKLGE